MKWKETELAQAVIWWLQDYQWEVYQEVQVFAYGDIADIVAVQNGIYWIIECKTTLNLEVMGQALAWKYFAHYVSVATPAACRPSKGRELARKILRDKGIGLLAVSVGHEITEKESASLYRTPHKGVGA